MSAKIRDVMASPVVTASRHHTLAHVRGIMHRHGIGSVPVLDPDGVPIGIVTVRDLIRPEASAAASVESIMSREVATVNLDDEAGRAARIMQRHGLHHLLVTSHGALIGIVSSFDLLALVDAPRVNDARASA